MEKENFSQQIQGMFERLRQFNWRDFTFWRYAIAWFVTFFYSFSPDIPSFFVELVAIVHVYFWFKLIAIIVNRIDPPSEALWGGAILLWVIEFLLVRIVLPADATLTGGYPTAWFTNSLQLWVLALLELCVGVLIYVNNEKKVGVLIWLLVLRFPVQSLLDSDSFFFLLIFQGIMVILFLKRTAWLERLTQAECWIYGIIYLALLQIVFWLNPVDGVSSKTWQYEEIWFELPGFLYQVLLTYTVAVLIRIPAILIYNHASLSRKLKISGLFQSSIPQIIQLVSLVLIFYSFITTWQAQIIRDRLVSFLQSAASAPASEHIRHFEYQSGDVVINWEGYQPLVARFLPKKGVLKLTPDSLAIDSTAKHADYFLFTRRESADSVRKLTVVKIDSAFLASEIANPQRYLGASKLYFYPATEEQWLWHYKQFNLWQFEQDFHIFPFGLINYSRINPIAVPLEAPGVGDFGNTNVTVGFLSHWKFTFGRVFVPIREAELTGQFAVFDVVLEIRPNFQWNDLLTVIVVALAFYSLLNIFIIQRMIGFGTRIHKIIIKKFRQLREGIQEISTGNLDYQIQFEGNDEFVELGKSFNSMGKRLKETMEERREKDRLQFELQNARDVQIGLLPHHLPITPGFEIAAVLHTATEVGGDFYDIFTVEEDKNGNPLRTLFAIGDVSGKGSSAALYMAQCMSLIRFASQITGDLGEICKRLNQYFATKIEDRQIFITLIIGFLDIKKQEVTFIRAGHTEPILLPADTAMPVKFLKSSGLGIGLSPSGKIFEKNLETVTVGLQPGDTLLFYTDGVVEANRPENGSDVIRHFDEERLIAELKNLRGKTAHDIQDIIDSKIKQFYGGHPRVDDHTLLVIRRCDGK